MNVNVRMKNFGGYDGLTMDTGELDAEQIVSQFAETAGLDLSDVVSNYAQYANAIQQSFSSQHSESSPFHF